MATDNHGRIHGDPCPWSVVRGPWIAFNGADARPWSVVRGYCLLAIAKAVRGLLSVDHGQLQYLMKFAFEISVQLWSPL